MVHDGLSGVVLPALSPATEYVKKIVYYADHPHEYMALRRTTRERYEKELNWNVAGRKIVAILQSVVEENQLKPGLKKEQQ
jgi:glycosyltransferase involved in cell wall biosynthesis